MNGIFIIDFNFVACDSLKFDSCEMLNVYVDFSYKISLRMAAVLVDMFENLRWFK